MKRFSLYIGITGALLMGACDIILLGQPVSGSQYDLSSFGAMEHVDSFRADFGSTLGLICAFFICFGFWGLKKLFEPVNEKLSMSLFISFGSMIFFGGAFHAAYYFLAVPGIGADYPNPIPMVVLNDFRNHLEILSYLGVPGFVIGTILFFKLAMDKRFPWWYKYCNPLVLNPIFLSAFYFLPAPVGGYLKPIFVNMATASLFVISAMVSSRFNKET